MKRRIFIAVCSGLVLTPIRTWAQQARTLPTIGVLRPTRPGDSSYQAFLLGLAELGYVQGKTILIEYRSGDGARLAEGAEELARLNVNAIFAPNPQGAQAARKATAAIPIVTAVIGDPVKTGLAASLAHPGGNVTGLTALGSNLSGKRLELLKEILPRLSRVAVLWNPTLPDKVIEWKEMEGPAKTLKIELLSLEVRTLEDFEPVFERAKRMQPGALIALGEPLVATQMPRVIEFATKARLPAMCNWREWAERGVLIAYGPDVTDLYRRAATYIDKILKGAKPGDLPIEQPTRFDFVVNLRTAKSLGITIPQSVLLRADTVIE